MKSGRGVVSATSGRGVMQHDSQEGRGGGVSSISSGQSMVVGYQSSSSSSGGVPGFSGRNMNMRGSSRSMHAGGGLIPMQQQQQQSQQQQTTRSTTPKRQKTASSNDQQHWSNSNQHQQQLSRSDSDFETYHPTSGSHLRHSNQGSVEYPNYMEVMHHTCGRSSGSSRDSIRDSVPVAVASSDSLIKHDGNDEDERGCLKCVRVGNTCDSFHGTSAKELPYGGIPMQEINQIYDDYYSLQQQPLPTEQQVPCTTANAPHRHLKVLRRRSSDIGLPTESDVYRSEHRKSFPSILRGRLKKEPTTCPKGHVEVENIHYSRISRSLEELPCDIKEHILKCQCSCDHLGYGNYSTLSLREVSNEILVLPRSSSLKGSVNKLNDKQEPPINYNHQRAELEIKYHVFGVLCLLLVLASVAGVGVSVPLALKTQPTIPTPTIPVQELEDNKAQRLEAANSLLEQTPLVDGHNDLPWNIRKFMHNRLHSFNMTADLSNLRPWSRSSWSHTDLPRLRKGRVGGQFWVAYVPCASQYMNAVQLTIEQVDLIKRLIDKYPNDLKLARSANDVEDCFREGKIASLIGVEGGHAIQNSLGVLRALSELGVRYMTLTHTCSTPWAESARNKETDIEDPNSPRGLTAFGKTVVLEMNRLGILVDLSHVSQATMRATLESSQAPILFSHSSVYSICKNPRNVPDDILKKVASNGGLIMVSFYNQFLTCSDKASIQDVIDHISHIRDVAGIDHVGIGADFDGVNKLPEGLEDVSKYPNLFAELMNDPKWSEDDLKKLAGLNLLRVLRQVEKVSRMIRNQHIGPYEDDVPFKEQKVKSNCAFRFLKDDRS